ncbi:MAG: hypothetical protein ACYC4U_02910 [Pirellulaceae bacterium]
MIVRQSNDAGTTMFRDFLASARKDPGRPVPHELLEDGALTRVSLPCGKVNHEFLVGIQGKSPSWAGQSIERMLLNVDGELSVIARNVDDRAGPSDPLNITHRQWYATLIGGPTRSIHTHLDYPW